MCCRAAGRCWVCAGDYPEEAAGLGLPHPSLATLFDLLEETVQACLRMWAGSSGDGEPFVGDMCGSDGRSTCRKACSGSNPPILIAGSGERRTLPLVPRYADACNLRPSPDIPRQPELLRRLCQREGRAYDSIEKTVPFDFDVGAAVPGSTSCSASCGGSPIWVSKPCSAGWSAWRRSNHSKSSDVR